MALPSGRDTPPDFGTKNNQGHKQDNQKFGAAYSEHNIFLTRYCRFAEKAWLFPFNGARRF